MTHPDEPPRSPEELSNFFAVNVRARREELDLSQGEVARRMTELGYKFHQTTVAKIEQGQRAVVVTEASGLARVLDISVHWLLAPPAVEGAVSTLRRQRSALIDSMEKLTELAHKVYEDHEALLSSFRKLNPDSYPSLRAEWAETLPVLNLNLDDVVREARERWREWGFNSEYEFENEPVEEDLMMQVLTGRWRDGESGEAP